MVAPADAQNQHVEIGVKILAEKKSPAYVLRLQMKEDQLQLFAFISVFDAENTIAPSELIELMLAHNVKEGVDLEEVAKFCSKAAMGINQEDIPLAKGTPPVPGKDGWLELTVKTGTDGADFQEDEQGNVDLRTLNTFTNVEDNHKIGIIHHPAIGEPGRTVHGEKIKAISGTPLELVAGDGVKLNEDRSQAFSTCGGRVVFDGHTLSVAEEFVVKGDVDLSVGNIDFNGVVEIKGDVLDDFNIRSSKGIRVSGAVGACRLESGGPIEIGSMAGLGRGLIRCRGDLRTKYLNQVQVECWGNVEVSHEIRNSSVKSTRAILVERGAISGGEAVALDGIEAKHLGSISGTKTRLRAGVYFPEADRLSILRYQQRSFNQQIQRITAAIGPLNKRKNLRKALQEAIELRASLLNQRKANLENEKVRVDAELESFKADEHPSANAKINILGSLKEGVAISLGETFEEINYEHTGPISVVENSQTGGLRFLDYSPLQISAEKIIEEAIAAQESAEVEEQGNATN
ncbi:MAG: FapA family protein [Geopsychrobacter sp.]|nr:FapA family protein [Geopsychrobacter sp.]